jgi:hypothetical protein
MFVRKSIAESFPIFLLTLSFALVDGHYAARGAEPEFALIVRDEQGRETRVSMGEIVKLPRASVRAKDEKGKEAVSEGTPLHEILKAAGVNLGEAIRGAVLANYLLVEAIDGYRVVFTLPEIDPAFTDLMFLLADRRDGQPLSEFEGRLRIVVPHEKRHARWVRKVVILTVQRAH